MKNPSNSHGISKVGYLEAAKTDEVQEGTFKVQFIHKDGIYKDCIKAETTVCEPDVNTEDEACENLRKLMSPANREKFYLRAIKLL